MSTQGTTTSTYFKVFGLQRSGTNLMRALISQNFQAEYLEERETGWKHGPLRLADGKWKGSLIRSVLCVKNPYAWAWSCYRFFQNSVGGDPTMAPQFQLDPSMSFEEFLLTPSYSFQTPIHRWNQMNRLWLATLPPAQTLVVRQEDQLLDQRPILQEAETKLSLTRCHERLQPIDRRVDVDVSMCGPMNRDYYLNHQYMENYSPCLLKRVNDVVDHSLMAELKYDLEQWTIEERQIGLMRLFVRPCTSDAAEAFQVINDHDRLSQIPRRADSVSTIIELGSGIGAWTLFAIKMCPRARLFAYEPCTSLQRLLRLNTRSIENINVLGLEQGRSPERDIRDESSSDSGILNCILPPFKDFDRISLLRIGLSVADSLFPQVIAPSIMRQVDCLSVRFSDQGPDPKLLTALSETHQVTTWTSPTGAYLLAVRHSV